MAKLKKHLSKTPAFIEHSSLTNANFIIFGIGILVIIIGYYIMATGDTYSFQSLSLAPVVLLIGYLIIVPVAILYKKKNNSDNNMAN